VSARIVLATCIAASLALAPDAHAMGAVISSPPGASSTVSVRTAVAGASGRTARWASVEVRGSATKFVWILPARTGAFVDLASDAWLEALAAATAPRVVPPNVAPPCGIPGGDEVDGDFTHTVTAAPEDVAVAGDRASLDALLAGWGLEVTRDVAPALDASLAAGDSLVALLYAAPSAHVVTRTVRIVDDSPESIALGLVGSSTSPIAVTAYAFAPGGVSLAAASAVAIDPASILWRSDGTSTYAGARDQLLVANPGAWLFETGGHDTLFEASAVPGGDTVPALVSTYFFRASSYADATEAPSGCAQAASSWESSAATVASACPQGALAQVGQAGCAEVIGAGQIDPGSFRCGGVADDLAVALSGLAPSGTWVTRTLSTIAPSSFGQDVAVTPAATAPAYGPVVTASGYAEPCAYAGSSGSSSPSSGGGGGGGGGNGGGSSSGASPGDPGGDPGGAVAVASAATDVASAASDSCDSSSSGDPSSSDSCSGSSTDPGSSDSSSSGCDVSTRRHSPTSRLGLLLVALAAVARRRGRRKAPREVAASQ